MDHQYSEQKSLAELKADKRRLLGLINQKKKAQDRGREVAKYKAAALDRASTACIAIGVITPLAKIDFYEMNFDEANQLPITWAMYVPLIGWFAFVCWFLFLAAVLHVYGINTIKRAYDDTHDA